MISIENWAELLSGDYSGWARPFGGKAREWEDLIGLVKIRAVPRPDNYLDVAIETIEWGTWFGRFHPGRKVLEGGTGQSGCNFRCRYQERRNNVLFGRRRNYLTGEIREEGDPVIEFRFFGEWR